MSNMFAIALLSLMLMNAMALRSINMQVINQIDQPLDIYWQSDSGELKWISSLTKNNSDTVINSFETHTFVVKTLSDEESLSNSWTNGPYDNHVTVVSSSEGIEAIVRDDFTQSQVTITDMITTCTSQHADSTLASCVNDGVYDTLNRLQSKLQTTKRVHHDMSYALRNYTCHDENIQTSPALRHATWDSLNSHVLFENSHAKIHLVEDFVRPEECRYMMDFAKPHLRSATVLGVNGTNVVSTSRKAQQAGYYFVPSDEYPTDPLSPLKQRIFDYTNHHTHLSLSVEGQEELTVIQYNAQDQYMPHCDGACVGDAHRMGGRVATMILYCRTPDDDVYVDETSPQCEDAPTSKSGGGGTTFSKANVFVRPKAGSATFFSYIGEDNVMDDGFTEHSGCPVFRDEKWIVTQWMRQGVTEDDDWNNFEPSGVRR